MAISRFSPYRRASRARLELMLFLLGPLLWVIALLVVAAVIRRSDIIVVGVLIAVGSFLLAAVLLAVIRRLRIAEESDASNPG